MKPANVKKLLLLPLLFMAGILIAQPPPAIPLQAVAKDAMGNPAKNRKVFIKDAIIKQKINGTVVWEEGFEVTTNDDGVYTINIGMGSKTSATTLKTIADIDWADGPYFLNLKIAVSPVIPASWWVASDNYIDLGTTQMMSVPYALFAGNATVTNVSTNITPGPYNTFLITDSLGNVSWAPPKAAQVFTTNVTNLNLSIQTGQNVDVEANTTAVVDVLVSGVQLGDPIVVTPQGDYPEWTVYSAWVSAPDHVSIRFANFTDTKVSVKGSQYKIIVIK
ncbi:MAG: hypothetical protein JO301_16230 [Chitinophagaceae bacterium]|nr:hypothetical protein [Chitinophagaceae bacterium]